MQRDLAAISDMLGAARDALALLGGSSIQAFDQDQQLQWAAAYRLIVVGEAATRTSDAFRDLYPEIPWREARGMRNFVIHEYEYVRWDVVWKTIRESLPPLIAQLERLLEEGP